MNKFYTKETKKLSYFMFYKWSKKTFRCSEDKSTEEEGEDSAFPNP